MTESTQYRVRITHLAVLPIGEPLFSEKCMSVSIEDESGGEFLAIEQHGGPEQNAGKISIDPEEWPALRQAIEQLLAECGPEK